MIWLNFTLILDYGDFGIKTVQLNASEHTTAVSIPLKSDLTVETTKALYASLSLLRDEFSCVTINPASAQLLIFDDDSEYDTGETMNDWWC